MGIFQASECSDTLNEGLGFDGQTAEIILSSEFYVYNNAWFDIYVCAYHQGDKNGYCSSDYATLGTSVTVDGTMQPGGGLRAGDGFCIAESMGSGQYYNYYFTLNQDASSFQIDGTPLEAYGSLFNPTYWISPQYADLITSLGSSLTYNQWDFYPKTIWVQGKVLKEPKK